MTHVRSAFPAPCARSSRASAVNFTAGTISKSPSGSEIVFPFSLDSNRNWSAWMVRNAAMLFLHTITQPVHRWLFNSLLVFPRRVRKPAREHRNDLFHFACVDRNGIGTSRVKSMPLNGFFCRGAMHLLVRYACLFGPQRTKS